MHQEFTVKAQQQMLSSYALPGVDVLSSEMTRPAVVARPRPVQRSRWASLVLSVAAAALMAACGGGGTDSTGSAAGSLDARMAAAVHVETAKSLGMKVLVISAAGTAPSYLAITSILDQIGVPYDRIVLTGSSKTALQMVAGTLSDGAGNGKYQGIILETGDLAAYNQATNNYPSALTAAQWAMLRQYQFDFGVRTATMYTRPALTIDVNGAALDLTYGLTYGSERSTDDFTSPPKNAVTATFTVAGAGVFSYLNSASPVIVKNAYTYLATPVAGTQTVPLLNATEGAGNYAIASTYTGDGWENLTITADSNPELTHALLTGYGVVNWVTKGVFLGERKIYLSAQPDDVFLPDDLWDPVSKTTPNDGANNSNPRYRHRNTATDYTSLVAWQTALQSNTQTAAIRLELPFNGVGYNTTDPEHLNLNETTDTLSPAVRANPNAFRWINHTWDHTSLVREGGFTPTVNSMLQQFQWNHEVATGLRSGSPDDGGPRVTFGLYNKGALVQPDISGLENTVFWSVAKTFGLQYILMDTSKAYSYFIPPRPSVGPIPPNTGYYSSLDSSNPKIVIIPRYPTNLFYNVSTPDEWASEFNYFYASKPPSQGGIGYVMTYPQILDYESEVLVRYMLKYNVNSWMFHAANLRDYDGVGGTNKSLLSDLLDAVTNKYKRMYNLPIVSPSQAEVGEIMRACMTYNVAIAGGLKARIVYGTTTTYELTNPSGVTVAVPVTGVDAGGVTYGGQTVSTVLLAPGQSTTISNGVAPPPAPQADLSISALASMASPLAGGTMTFSLVISNAGPGTATGASFADTLPAGLSTITNVTSAVSAGASTATFSNTGSALSGSVSLPAGGKVTVTFQVQVAASAGGNIANVATVNAPAGTTDPNLANNTASASVAVAALADVSTTLRLPAGAPAGSVVSVTVTFSNSATGGAATGVGGTVTLSNGDVRVFSLGTLAPGGSSVQTFATTVPSAVSLNGTSTVATSSAESNTANNTATAALLVQSQFADVTTTVTMPATRRANRNFTVNVTFTNAATGAAALTATGVTGRVTLSNGVVRSYNGIGSLAPGASVSRSFSATAPSTVGATVTATSLVTTTAPESNTANNTATATLTVVP
jgi:uncharacterized repeat protein (TIGR01451 family)